MNRYRKAKNKFRYDQSIQTIRMDPWSNLRLGLVLVVSLMAMQMPVLADTPRDQLFDSGWLFLRSDAAGAENPAFDDSSWRKLDLPHDWSIEDLPARKNQVPELSAVQGEWRFKEGDDPLWKNLKLDDSGWQRVNLPDTWEHHSNYNGNNAYGWFRRHIQIPANCKGKDFDLLMGRIDDVDEVWLNEHRIGGMGSFPPNYQSAWDVERRYRVPANIVRGDGSDVIAVRVYNGDGNGGIYDAGTKGTRIGPFDPEESQGGGKTGYVVGGVGWYRKHFVLNETDQRVAVRFDGVYMNADFWINGQLLGNHPYGYTSFEFDLTPHLKKGENVLAVRVNNDGKNSRWYSGSGIYRHVWLTTTAAIHVPTWGVFVTTPDVSKEKATVRIASEIRNDSVSGADAVIRAQIQNPAGQVVVTAETPLNLPRGETHSIEQIVEIPSPKLWGIDSPDLYLAQVEVVVGGKTIDASSTRFGIRQIQIDAEHGFRLNGQTIKLKGGCIHHDNGPLGSAAIDRAEERKVELMKANGFNAIRTSHNPPSPALLDACDRLGMLVIDEAFDQWNEQKIDDAQDYHLYFKNWHSRDIASMVRRDRNHPSVILWSIGNEIPERFQDEADAKALRDQVLANDPSRQITAAICAGGVDWDTASDPAFAHLDVAGYNYLRGKYESDHARHPDRVIVATETFPQDCFDDWAAAEAHPYVIGNFVWTAIDYFGESGIGHSSLNNQQGTNFRSWPWFDAWCGDLDVCGFKKPQSLYRDVVWGRSMLEIAVHTPIPAGASEQISAWGWPDELQSWNWHGREGIPLQVSVYSRCETVRLELNGKVIGEQASSAATKLKTFFHVPYEPGQLRAIGLIGGKVAATATLQTSGEPKALKLSPDRSTIHADRNDLCYVAVEAVDANGQRVPDAEISIKLSVSGPGELAAVCAGAPNIPASFRHPLCTTFRGGCLAILRPTGSPGEITLRCEAKALDPATIAVQAE